MYAPNLCIVYLQKRLLQKADNTSTASSIFKKLISINILHNFFLNNKITQPISASADGREIKQERCFCAAKTCCQQMSTDMHLPMIHRFFLSILFLLFVFSVSLAAQNTHSAVQSADKSAAESSGRWYSNLFVSGGLQTFIPVSLLKDYTQPKPGYRLALGYTFFRSKKHTMPVYLETGHSVILGVNPLVRSFDTFPITVNAAYEYFPIRHLSVGAFAGIGLCVLQIGHYPTAIDLLTNKLKATRGVDGVFSAGVSVGSEILDRSIEFKAAFSIDVLLEKKRPVPLPSFQAYIRVYPGAVYAYARRKNTPAPAVQPAAPAEVKPAAPIIIEKKIEKPAEKPLAQFEAIYVYFNPESADLDVNAKGDIKKAAAILKEHKDLFVLFESSAAPFGSQSGRLKVEAARIIAVSGYLQKSGITQNRIIYNEPKDKKHKKEDMPEEEFYTQYRYVKLRFVRLQFNPNEGKNVYRSAPITGQPDQITETIQGETK